MNSSDNKGDQQRDSTRLEQQLKSSQEISDDLLQIIQTLDSQIFRCIKNKNNDYVIIFNEGVVAERNNISTRKVKGKKIREIIGEELFGKLKKYYDQAFSGKTVKYRGFEFDNRVYSTVLTPFKKDEAGHVVEAVGITQDITDQHLIEQDYQRKTDILDRIIEHNPYSIQILDAEGYHMSENKAFFQLFKTRPDKKWSILKDPLILERGYSNTFDRMLKGQVVATEPFWYNAHHIDRKYPDNPICIGSVIFPIFLSDGHLEHIVVMHENITERVKAQEELIIAKEKAEESDRLKSSFLANMSHEIRTPLNGIFGFADLLKEKDVTESEKEEYAEVIKKSGNRMLNIMNDLVSISKIEAGQMELNKVDTDVNEIMKHLYQLFGIEASQEGLGFHFKGEYTEKPFIVHTDREKLYSVMSNLLKNAIKFTSEGRVEFGYVLNQGAGIIEFYVKDTGPGILPEHQHNIFKRFYQTDSKVTNARDGAGLGLAISSAYVEMMGGEIWVDSKPGAGSVFYFTIPVNKVEDQNLVTETEHTVRSRGIMTGATVLIVDDDQISRKYFKTVLADCNVSLLIANNGKEAVDICRKYENIQLIIMDLRMPVMDGHTATQYIKSFRPNLPVVALTAFALKQEKDKYGKAFDDYLTKPINADNLRKIVRKYVLK